MSARQKLAEDIGRIEMRWEWRDAIRFLDWEALEKFSRDQPCAELADTIFELSIGLDNKDDIRAAKRLLFQLEQKGFCPSQTEGPAPAKYEAPKAGKFGVITTTDWNGTFFMNLVHTTGKKVRILRASVNQTGHYCAVNSVEVPFGHLHRYRSQLMLENDKERRPFTASPEYVLYRLAWYRNRYGFTSDSTRESITSIHPYWDRLLDGCPEIFPPLVEGLPEASLQSVDVETFWLQHPHAKQWRLIVTGCLYRGLMSELRHIEAHTHDKDERIAQRTKYLLDNRTELLKEFFSFDFAMRFMDLATLALLQGDEVMAQMCMRCHGEIGRQGVSHPFFDRLIEKTAEDLSMVAAKDFSEQKHFLFRPPAAVA